ncbi:MAG: 23S rRNA (guanosine(2251)-2'-O)-methyltransferase RlmB [Bacteroidota bacterium]|nr:23S rRNA (guanosine(2251)-2'-O)-methyltransferase RlmB [Bacteroidota bacterium]
MIRKYQDRKPESNNFVFGIRAIEETLKSGKPIERILFAKSQTNVNHLVKEAGDRKIPYSFVPEEKLNSITRKNHQGAICYVSPIEYSDLENLIMDCFDKGTEPFVLVLDRITDVRNMGAIARTALCAGVDILLLPIKNSAQINEDAMKTSAGALNHLPVSRTDDLKKAVRYLKDSGLTIVACTEKAKDDIFATELKGPVALVVGSEEDGISDDIMRIADYLVKIPISGKLDSLNVSVAAGISMFEVVRQRGKQK